ncbi:MAG: hypothetical protein M3348_11050 [Acidobacteriota bacterium]|nr:hypothetical protein [Acidobacteriota bacterium]
MPKFRKKPVVIEAVQWWPNVDHPAVNYDNAYTVNDAFFGGERLVREGPYVVTIHKEKAHLTPGDWIIPEPDGLHFYPCKPDIFRATYEPVDDDVKAERGDANLPQDSSPSST